MNRLVAFLDSLKAFEHRLLSYAEARDREFGDGVTLFTSDGRMLSAEDSAAYLHWLEKGGDRPAFLFIDELPSSNEP